MNSLKLITSYIFILLFENNKYFIGKTNDKNFKYSNYFEIRKYKIPFRGKPIKLLDFYQEKNIDDVNNAIIKMMVKYGIDNVRGGIYTSRILNKNDHHLLYQACKQYSSNKIIKYNIYTNKDDFIEWLYNYQNESSLYIFKRFLIDYFQVKWFSIDYGDRYLQEKIWLSKVLNIRKEILNDYDNIKNIIKELNNMTTKLHNGGSGSYLKFSGICSDLIKKFKKLQVPSYEEYFDFFNDLIMIEL